MFVLLPETAEARSRARARARQEEQTAPTIVYGSLGHALQAQTYLYMLLSSIWRALCMHLARLQIPRGPGPPAGPGPPLGPREGGERVIRTTMGQCRRRGVWGRPRGLGRGGWPCEGEGGIYVLLFILAI